jgi:peptidyl-tRNA hydrolase, PTH1 family
MRAGKLFGSAGIRKKSGDLKSEYYIIGLGNPGAQYEHTRHNAGFDVVSVLAQRHNIPTRIFKYKARLGTGIIKDKKVTLVMPQTYMNNSGESVREIADALRVKQEQLIIVYDDIDLKAGAVRIKSRGSAGTHNGMKSIVYHLQTDEFVRVRVGIGKPEGELVDYVLGEHTDKKTAFDTLCKAADAIETILAEGIDEAQSRFN